jgi:hypothetical protein
MATAFGSAVEEVESLALESPGRGVMLTPHPLNANNSVAETLAETAPVFHAFH